MTPQQLAEKAMFVKKAWDGLSGAAVGGALGAAALGGLDYYKNQDKRRALTMALLGGGLGAGAGGFAGHVTDIGKGDPVAGAQQIWGNVTGTNPVVRLPGGDVSAAAINPQRQGIHPSMTRDVVAPLAGVPAIAAAGGLVSKMKPQNPVLKLIPHGPGVGKAITRLGIPAYLGYEGIKAYNALAGDDAVKP